MYAEKPSTVPSDDRDVKMLYFASRCLACFPHLLINDLLINQAKMNYSLYLADEFPNTVIH
jgi:hypothetical protein